MEQSRLRLTVCISMQTQDKVNIFGKHSDQQMTLECLQAYVITVVFFLNNMWASNSSHCLSTFINSRSDYKFIVASSISPDKHNVVHLCTAVVDHLDLAGSGSRSAAAVSGACFLPMNAVIPFNSYSDTHFWFAGGESGRTDFLNELEYLDRHLCLLWERFCTSLDMWETHKTLEILLIHAFHCLMFENVHITFIL